MSDGAFEAHLAELIRSAAAAGVRDALKEAPPSAPASAAPGDCSPSLSLAVTVREAAEALSVSTDTVHRMVADGRLPVVRLTPQTVRIPRIALEALCTTPQGGDPT